MNIRIIAIGKIKEDYLKNGISEYLKRLQKYAKVEIVELPDSPIVDNPNQSDIEKAKNQEGERVLKILKPNDYVINLDMNKKEMESPEFATYLSKKFVVAGSNLTFVIGGSYGLSDKLKERANDAISLSKMTFLHQMTRLILLEQVYRSFKILNNEIYHK